MGQLANRTQGQQLVQANPKAELKQVLEKSWPRIQAVMTKETSPERLYQMYVSTINKEPQLAECGVESVLSCFMQCTALGLEPSNVNGLGQVYILPYGNKNHTNGKRDAQLIIGYKGMIELARRSGQLKSIHAQAVYEGDEYEHWEDEKGQHFTFKANPKANHEPQYLTDVYVNAQLNNGGFVFESMTKSEVEQVKKRSASGNRGPWGTDYEAMAKKTVIRRSFKYLPVSVEAKTAAVVDETTPDYHEVFSPVIDTVDDNQPFSAKKSEEATRVEHISADAEFSDSDSQHDSAIPNRLQPIIDAYKTIGCTLEDARPAIEHIINRKVDDFNTLTDAEIEKIMNDYNKGTKK
jgi:recombination protein RecT